MTHMDDECNLLFLPFRVLCTYFQNFFRILTENTDLVFSIIKMKAILHNAPVFCNRILYSGVCNLGFEILDLEPITKNQESGT